MDQMKRLRGRPKGTLNGKRFTTPWEPKKWKPIYDTVTALHVSGCSNVEISKETHLTVVQIGNIINSQKGKERVEELKKIYTNRIITEHKEIIERISRRSLEIVDKVLHNDVLVENKALSMFDRSVRVLQGTNILKQPTIVSTPNDNPQLSHKGNLNILFANSETANRIADGISKLIEIKLLTDGNSK